MIKWQPKHRCIRCGARGRVRVKIGGHVHLKWFCSAGCIRAYREKNPGRMIWYVSGFRRM